MIAEVSLKYDLAPTTIEEWMEKIKKGMDNHLRARPKILPHNTKRRSKK